MTIADCRKRLVRGSGDGEVGVTGGGVESSKVPGGEMDGRESDLGLVLV